MDGPYASKTVLRVIRLDWESGLFAKLPRTENSYVMELRPMIKGLACYGLTCLLWPGATYLSTLSLLLCQNYDRYVSLFSQFQPGYCIVSEV
jgi:hypothetical protein